jgi:hypothetical protein
MSFCEDDITISSEVPPPLFWKGIATFDHGTRSGIECKRFCRKKFFPPNNIRLKATIKDSQMLWNGF